MFITIIAIAIGLTQVQATESNQPDPSTPKLTQVADARLNRRIEEGLEYFRDLAAQQLSLTEELLVTLRDGDLEAAQDAYIEARPPYEEIEVFAASLSKKTLILMPVLTPLLRERLLLSLRDFIALSVSCSEIMTSKQRFPILRNYW